MEKLLTPFLEEHDAKCSQLWDKGEEKLEGWKVHVGLLRKEYAAWRDEVVKLMHVVNARTRQYHNAFWKLGIKRPIELLVMGDEKCIEESGTPVMMEEKGESLPIPCIEKEDKFGVMSLPTASRHRVDSEATLEMKDNEVDISRSIPHKKRRRMVLQHEESTSTRQQSVEKDEETRFSGLQAGCGQHHGGGKLHC